MCLTKAQQRPEISCSAPRLVARRAGCYDNFNCTVLYFSLQQRTLTNPIAIPFPPILQQSCRLRVRSRLLVSFTVVYARDVPRL